MIERAPFRPYLVAGLCAYAATMAIAYVTPDEIGLVADLSLNGATTLIGQMMAAFIATPRTVHIASIIPFGLLASLSALLGEFAGALFVGLLAPLWIWLEAAFFEMVNAFFAAAVIVAGALAFSALLGIAWRITGPRVSAT